MDKNVFAEGEKNDRQLTESGIKMVEKRRALREPYEDRIRGSLVGGAIGDALGYTVEFMSWKEIQKRFGDEGILQYKIDFETGTAVFSDDTQMTLFTANGILIGETDNHMNGIHKPIPDYVYSAYLEWLETQKWGSHSMTGSRCWLYEIPDLHVARAPGNTCLSALRSGKMGSVDAPVNYSKGCGGVMRVAPLALHYQPESDADLRQLDMDSAQIAAITHGHPLGYLPAAILNHIISIGVYGDGKKTLKEAVDEAWFTVKDMFKDRVKEEDLDFMESLIIKAESLAAIEGDDEEKIRAIGQGWTGDEALAIAIYCSLRYPDDFSKAIIASVNHSGDSDSTGAITGNILGAWLGYDAIEEKWKRNLEMKKVLLEMADDLCYGCEMYKDLDYVDEDWVFKYCEGHARRTV